MLVDSGKCQRISRILGMPRTPALEPQPIAFFLVAGTRFRLTIERIQTPDGFQIRSAMSPFSMSSVVDIVSHRPSSNEKRGSLVLSVIA
jgi:hypothetical protein